MRLPILIVLAPVIACSAPPSESTPPDAGAPDAPNMIDASSSLPAIEPGLPEQPAAFDPASCNTPLAVRFLDGTKATVRSCTIAYSGQDNLGECTGPACFNQIYVRLPTTFQDGAKVPAIVYIHGGGWAAGTPTEADGDTTADYLSRGFAVLSLSYRFSPEATKNGHFSGDPSFLVDTTSGRADGPTPYRTALADVKTAVQFIRTKMSATIDADNLVGMGHSAGAHLTMMLATTGDANNANVDANLRGRIPNVSTVLKAAIAKAPPTDFGVFAADNPHPPVCGEHLAPALAQANECGVIDHTMGHPASDSCTSKYGAFPACDPNGAVWGDNTGCESRPWSSEMVGQPLSFSPSYFQSVVSPVWTPASAPIFVLSGACDPEASVQGPVNFYATAIATYGAVSMQRLAVKILGGAPGLGNVDASGTHGAGHNSTLDEDMNPGGNLQVRQWLQSNGLPIVP